MLIDAKALLNGIFAFNEVTEFSSEHTFVGQFLSDHPKLGDVCMYSI